MKVLITGNNGYIGTILSHELQKKNFDVFGLDTGYYDTPWLYDIKGYKKPNYLKKDIRKVTLEDLKGFDAIVHLAELSNDPLGENDPNLTYKINHEGTIHLAELAKKNNIEKFIYFSSCSVYGASDQLSNENSKTNPLTAYAKSKIMNEKDLIKMSSDDFAPILFRNATVFGASPRLRFDLVVNNLAGLAFTTKEIKMDSDGTPWRPFVHIKDVAQAVICALETKKEILNKQIINIGDTKSNYQIKTIAQIIGDVFPGCSISLNKNGTDKRNYRVNFDKIKKIMPQFTCKYDVKKGAEELLQIFKKVNLTYEDFQSRNYTRLKQIKYLRETKKLDSDLFWN